MKRAYAFSGGLFLAVLQFCFFLLLEWQLSSAWTTYMAVTVSWMVGIFLGLSIRLRWEWANEALLAATVVFYYLLWLVLSLFPFDSRILPFCALCVLAAGAYAGWFFRWSYPRMKDARELLLFENNGFVCGLFAGFFFFAKLGSLFLAIAPALLAAVLAVLSVGIRERASR